MLPYNSDLVGTKDIANSLRLDRKYVTNTITKLPDFPKPVINYSQKLRLWDRHQVEDFFNKKTRKNTITPHKSRNNLATY